MGSSLFPSRHRHGALRRAADVCSLSLLLGVPLQVLLDNAPGAIAMALIACVAVAARKVAAPAWAEFVFVALLALDGWLTALGAFATFNRNDIIGHVLLPAAVTPLLYTAATRAGVLRADASDTIRHNVATGFVLAALTLALGTAWEITEWLADTWLGTDMSLGYADTLGDLAADAVGGAAGAILTLVCAAALRRSKSPWTNGGT